ncbi:MAG: Lrp/AsnC ligand binding domain-containing protein [Pseudomonadota bacterium]
MSLEIDRIDRIDRRILQLLQTDGRITNAALSEAVSLSPNATAERVKRLVASGVIEGFAAVLNPERLRRSFLVFVEVKLDRTDGDVFAAFAEAARQEASIVECHMVAGGFDYLLKTRHADMAAYRAFLSQALLSLPGIRETHSYPVMDEVKAGGALPIVTDF